MANDSEVENKKDSIPGIDYDPGTKKGPASYSMIEPRLKNIYAQFYKETYYTDKKVLDAKTQELIALACSLVAKCDGCIEGHIKKRAVGEFVLPALLKIATVRKPATKARKGINPFTKEEVMFKAKPATTVVKVRPLKKLKDMAL